VSKTTPTDVNSPEASLAAAHLADPEPVTAPRPRTAKRRRLRRMITGVALVGAAAVIP
jgi:hypothetical protein